MNKPLTKTEIAVATGKSLFHAAKVKSVTAGMGKTERVIKKSTNAKLGKRVTKGKLAGFPIYTVTLEERATCPSTCAHWADCYGNNMPFATRYAADDTLIETMGRELESLNKRHPDGFLVRLHVLGDFYSVDYVAHWANWLDQFPALHVYGYSAWHDDTSIGMALDQTRRTFGTRFMVRQSGNFDQPYMTALSADDIRAMDKVNDKQAFVCPVQLDKTPDCGACGLCWTARKPVVFITH